MTTTIDHLHEVHVMTEEVATNTAEILNATSDDGWKYVPDHRPGPDCWVIFVYDEDGYYIGAL